MVLDKQLGFAKIKINKVADGFLVDTGLKKCTALLLYPQLL